MTSPCSVLPMPSPDAMHPTILLAEDDTPFRELLARCLRDAGYVVIEARSGAELLDYAAFALLRASLSDPVHLIITDVRMPGMSGMDVVARLQKARCLPKTIVMSAFGSAELHDQALALGALAVFDKPFDIQALLDEVAQRLGRAA